MKLSKSVIELLNRNQNNLIRYMFGLHRYTHMSDLLTVLNVFDIENLIIFRKLTFIKHLKNNFICYSIFHNLLLNLNSIHKKSPSFIIDFSNICKHLNLEHNYLLTNILYIITIFKNNYKKFDCDNIKFQLIKNCLDNYDNNMRSVLTETLTYN